MHSLIAPADRPKSVKKNLVVEPLSSEETIEGMKALYQNITFTQTDRYYADPVQPQQRIALVSFVPAKGAKPDKDNIFGMMKVRGVYASEQEADERAEFLIRNVDSYHEIFHAYVGRPFPVTNGENFAQSIKNIDIRAKTTEVISEDILNKKREEKRQVEDIKDREKALLEESKRAQADEPRDPFEEYITENVKRAQVAWTYHETRKKMDQMRKTYFSAVLRIKELDESNKDFAKQYLDKYMEARKSSGIQNDNNSFIEYLGLDLDVPIEDAEDQLVTRK